MPNDYSDRAAAEEKIVKTSDVEKARKAIDKILDDAQKNLASEIAEKSVSDTLLQKEKKLIEDNPNLDAYYKKVQTQLNRNFLGSALILSNTVEAKQSSHASKEAFAAKAVMYTSMKALPPLAVAAAAAAYAIGQSDTAKIKRGMNNLSSVSASSNLAEYAAFSEKLARTLTISMQEKIILEGTPTEGSFLSRTFSSGNKSAKAASRITELALKNVQTVISTLSAQQNGDEMGGNDRIIEEISKKITDASKVQEPSMMSNMLSRRSSSIAPQEELAKVEEGELGEGGGPTTDQVLNALIQSAQDTNARMQEMEQRNAALAAEVAQLTQIAQNHGLVPGQGSGNQAEEVVAEAVAVEGELPLAVVKAQAAAEAKWAELPQAEEVKGAGGGKSPALSGGSKGKSIASSAAMHSMDAMQAEGMHSMDDMQGGTHSMDVMQQEVVQSIDEIQGLDGGRGHGNGATKAAEVTEATTPGVLAKKVKGAKKSSMYPGMRPPETDPRAELLKAAQKAVSDEMQKSLSGSGEARPETEGPASPVGKVGKFAQQEAARRGKEASADPVPTR
jgi:hypothetical protein